MRIHSIRNLLISLIISCSTGCGSLIAISYPPDGVYKGTKTTLSVYDLSGSNISQDILPLSLYLLVVSPFVLVSLPFDLVIDTALLPTTLPNKQHGQQKTMTQGNKVFSAMCFKGVNLSDSNLINFVIILDREKAGSIIELNNKTMLNNTPCINLTIPSIWKENYKIQFGWHKKQTNTLDTVVNNHFTWYEKEISLPIYTKETKMIMLAFLPCNHIVTMPYNEIPSTTALDDPAINKIYTKLKHLENIKQCPTFALTYTIKNDKNRSNKLEKK